MASQNIKGITIEIGGDTTELSSALKGLDKSAKNSSAELGEINRQLKMDPSNTVLLAQKQEVLAKSIGTAKEKLELLRKAEEQAAEQLKNDKIGEEQFRALQREVVYAENKLKKLEGQLEDTEKAAKGEGKAVEKSGQQSRDAAKDAEALKKELDELKDKYDNAKDSAKDAGKELGGTFAAAGAAVVAATASAMGYEDALDAIQIQTGAGKAEMDAYKKAMDGAFSSGLGEDLDDIAATMATISQQTKEVNPGKLQEMTEAALLLRDSFGFEAEEQMRAVTMLTGKFGISSKEAYDLIVAGAQQGLNKNGDLLDVINEYSSHYAQMGYDAKGFFNSLASGTATGVFSVDKLGDAMKEFGIRSKDNATSTTEAYELLGLESEKMLAKFAAGGEEAQEATALVVSSLFSMSDQVQQNQVGVALFGTMWEDLGKDAIQALMSANTSLKDVEGSMEAVRDIRLNSTSNQWEQLGRTVQTELILPLGEKALPVAQKLFQYCIDNSESLFPKLKALGVLIGTVFAINKAAKFTKSIKDLVAAYKALKTATQAANAAQSASLWGAIAAAIALVVSTIFSSVAAQKDAAAAAQEHKQALMDLSKEQLDYCADLATAEKEAVKLRRETAKAVNEEYDEYSTLWDELQKLVDAEGNVLKGNEERVDYIRGELSQAIGEEIDMVDGQIQKYKELSQRMDETLIKQRTARMIERQESNYEAAKESLPSLQQAYEEANADWNTYQEDLTAYEKLKEAMLLASAEVARAGKNYNRSDMNSQQALLSAQANLANIKSQMDDLELKLAQTAYAGEARKEALRAYDEAMTNIAYFEALETAYYSGDTSQMTIALQASEKGYMTAETAHPESLQSQYQDARAEYLRLDALSKQPGSIITKAQLEAAEEAAAITYAAIGGQVPSTQYTSGVPWTQPKDTPALLKDFAQLILTPSGSGSSDYLRVEDESSKQSYALLQRIYDRLEQLDLTLVLDDGTLVGRTAQKTDYALGNIIAQDQRGTLKE